MPADADADAGAPQDSFALFMREIARHPLLTREQEVLLARRIERGDRDAMERMVNSNLRLVIANARGYEGLGVPLPDLIQEGSLGLIRAAEGFDHRKGFKFSTYATFWIRQAIGRALDNGSRAIRIPATAGRRGRRLDRTERELEARLGREPTTAELAEAAQLTTEQVAEIRDAARVVTSIDRPVGDDEATELGSLLADESADPLEELYERSRHDAVHAAVEQLPEPERWVVRRRYGIGGDEPAQLVELGRRLGISPERVKALELRALRELAGSRELEALRPAA